MHKQNFKSLISQNVTFDNKRLIRLIMVIFFLFCLIGRLLRFVEGQTPMVNNLNDNNETNIECEKHQTYLR